MKRRVVLATAVAVACAGLSACAVTPSAPPDPAPVLRLPPAALGRTLALQQSLDVTVQGRSQHVDVMLEADSEAVRMALVSLGQTVARMVWDGKELQETRARWLPESVKADRILSDLQLTLWPAEAVRAALPEGWSLDSSDAERVLRQRGNAVVRVSYPEPSKAVIEQWRDGYRIDIVSRGLGAASGTPAAAPVAHPPEGVAPSAPDPRKEPR